MKNSRYRQNPSVVGKPTRKIKYLLVVLVPCIFGSVVTGCRRLDEGNLLCCLGFFVLSIVFTSLFFHLSLKDNTW